jgi:hypothetical protein
MYILEGIALLKEAVYYTVGKIEVRARGIAHVRVEQAALVIVSRPVIDST